jgi:hypothetical protein
MGSRARVRVRVAVAALAVAALAGTVACSLVVDTSGLANGAAQAPAGSDASIDAEASAPNDAGDSSAAPDAGVICRPGMSGADCMTACPTNKAGRACDFTRVLALEIPVTARWMTAAEVPYAQNDTAKVTSFTRVAYRLQLDADEVWVELDAFTTEIGKIGVPAEWVFQSSVTNVVVYSFASNQKHVLAPSMGNIELWHHCYGEGADGKYDANDAFRPSEPHCYGSMQLHVSGSPVLAFNRWVNTDPIDLGIGRAPSGEPDWTFSGTAANFKQRRLEVFVR